MGTRKYILLHDLNRAALPSRGAGGVHTARAAMSPGPAAPRIEVTDLSRKDLIDAFRDPGVSAAAPQVPIKLVEPSVSEGPAAGALAGSATWGVDAVGAIRSRYDGSGVKVAILDTGVDAAHAAFEGVRFEQRDYTGEGDGDPNGHGTHCAGTVFGRAVGGKRIGVATGITDVFIGKVLGQRGGGGSDSIARAVMEAAQAGCSVISMSLGIDFPGYARVLQEQQGFPPELAAGVALDGYRANVRLFDTLGEHIESMARFNGREILLIAASGNESRREAHANFELPATPPSDAEGFLSVGAVGRVNDNGQLTVANFSNTSCAVCAPGVNVLSAKANSGSELVALNGTSMATPHAAGIAALWIQKVREDIPPSSGFFGRALEVEARLVGAASRARFGREVDRFDVGAGLVQAP